MLLKSFIFSVNVMEEFIIETSNILQVYFIVIDFLYFSKYYILYHIKIYLSLSLTLSYIDILEYFYFGEKLKVIKRKSSFTE